MRALLVAGVFGMLPLAACFGGGYECTTDFDCSAGTVCANTHACLGPGEVQRVAIHWTVRGNRADDFTCASIPELDLAVFDDQTDDQASYAPVPCSSGQFVFDKLPTHFDRVLVRVINGGETVEAPIPPGGGDLYLDFTSGDLPALDAGPVVDASPPDAAPLVDAGI